MMESFFSSIVPVLVVSGLGLGIYFIARSKNDGTGLVKEFKAKKVIFLEVILAGMNLIEAMVAAEISETQGVNYATRLGMHLFLALLSIVVGTTYFSQLRDMAIAIKEVKRPTVIIKETVEVLFASVLLFVPPFANTMFIVLGRGKANELEAFMGNMGHLHVFQAMFSVKDPVSFVSSIIFVLHVIGIIYLGLYGLELAKDQLETEPEDEPEPEITVKPFNKPRDLFDKDNTGDRFKPR